MLSYLDDRENAYSYLNIVWKALHTYREYCLLEGEEDYDNEWSDITTAMAWITEDLGIEMLEED